MKFSVKKGWENRRKIEQARKKAKNSPGLEIILPNSQANALFKKRKDKFPSTCSLIWGKLQLPLGHLSPARWS